MARSIKEVHTINYYPINEGAARRAKEMNSFSDYKEGSATAEYRAMVDKAAAIAEQQKSRVDPMYHEKIDHLLDTYARKLAENMNQGFAIDARVPSVLIAGPSNFPVGKKEKQNRARDSNMEEWRHTGRLGECPNVHGTLGRIILVKTGGLGLLDTDIVKAPVLLHPRRKVLFQSSTVAAVMPPFILPLAVLVIIASPCDIGRGSCWVNATGDRRK